ncbi:MAG: hypothetical protein JNG88_11525, partial [Phycisphaerales bacterium]|nr:hypothetical protein [Phycisphaerales bacterium]
MHSAFFVLFAAVAGAAPSSSQNSVVLPGAQNSASEVPDATPRSAGHDNPTTRPAGPSELSATSTSHRPVDLPGIQRVAITRIEVARNATTSGRIENSAEYESQTPPIVTAIVHCDSTPMPPLTPEADDLLLIARGGTPLGWGRPLKHANRDSSAARSPTAAQFAISFELNIAENSQQLRAWIVRPALLRELRPRWPEGAPLAAVIDSVGPGQRHAWLQGGGDRGFETGQSWWMRLAGQPVARLDARFTADELTFCRIIPLVADSPLAARQVVELWPMPSEQRRGRVGSAVVFCEDRGSDQRVWIAAPPDVGFPSEPQIDFLRGGRYVGHGVVEQRDEAFWYVRVAAKACLERIAVGDDARVRTLTMIHRREFVAHVFESTPDGFLMDAGEAENIVADQSAFAWRDGAALGEIRVTRVQSDYAIIRQVGQAVQPLVRGDEIRFAPLAEASSHLRVGVVRHVVGGSIFTAEMSVNRRPSARVPVAVEYE